MVTLLAKIFIQEKNDQAKIREEYGVLCGVVGILFNVLLFAGKFLAGTISHSIAITADAVNNLSDAGSSIVTLAGFKLAGTKPDPEHPFGHGRIEYISGLVVAAAILLMAYELIRDSGQDRTSGGDRVLRTDCCDSGVVDSGEAVYVFLQSQDREKA